MSETKVLLLEGRKESAISMDEGFQGKQRHMMVQLLKGVIFRDIARSMLPRQEIMSF